MVAVVLALGAALAYGVSDFLGGLASRRDRTLPVVATAGPTGLVLLVLLLPLGGGEFGATALAWGAAAGVVGGAGITLLYAGLAAGPMNVVSPLAAICSAALPVLVGALIGEHIRPLAWAGIAAALLAIALVGSGDNGQTGGRRAASPWGGVALGLLAGVGFGLFFVLLERSPDESGLWPVVAARAAASVLYLAAAVAARGPLVPTREALPTALWAGVLDATANLLYLVAVREGMLSLVAVIVALYPAGTVLLARYVFHERTTAAQRVGLAAATAGVALIALGR